MKWNVQQMAALSLLGEEERGAILVVLLSLCVSVSVCLTGCVLHYLDLSGVFKGFYSLGILKLEQALEILACNGEGERSRTHSLLEPKPEPFH